ncbi:hypothetical protein DYBT9275_05655 [Dyadobacter sp. CECT 9275]|uniref:Sigma-70 family RNA polymerase sigma factor n=1 Tax=Dyadobacter helix TaxID=2822344 RepID=A0A916JIR1_9BACT|nr:RNA polymerase sigma factor [Dyadobacter sp. CECT 9275]CAG5016874.1 hypothetical protein DYBT9275_05655 [Dyadobacter sp. CECT 9275]
MKTLKKPEDHVLLWESFREGNREAFSRIYELYASELYRYGYNLVRDKELVEDCIQELFLSMYVKGRSLGTTDNIRFYLYKAVRNRLLNAISRKKSILSANGYAFETSEFVIQPVEKQLIEQQHHSMRARIIASELNKLPRRQKEILYLVYLRELSYPEAAEIMGITIKSVYNTVHIALSSLKKCMKDSFYQEGLFYTFIQLITYGLWLAE